MALLPTELKAALARAAVGVSVTGRVAGFAQAPIDAGYKVTGPWMEATAQATGKTLAADRRPTGAPTFGCGYAA